MGTKSRVRAGMQIGLATLAMILAANVVRAGVSTDRPGSILILPKVTSQAGVRDTVIQIANTSNSLVHAHCFYLNGAIDPRTNTPLWLETDFSIWLTRQQPTHWLASNGRRLDPSDPLGTEQAGLDPGSIPPVVDGFAGELICIQVDSSGSPVGGNALKGEATLLGPVGDVSKYNGITIAAINADGDQVLSLDNAEYAACPSRLLFTHTSEPPATDLVFGQPVSNNLTLIPCTQNLEDQLPSNVQVSISVSNELEERASGNFPIRCFLDSPLSGIQVANPLPNTNPFNSFSVFGPFLYSSLTPLPTCVGGSRNGLACGSPPAGPFCPNGSCLNPGLLGVLETTYSDGAVSTRAAQNLHTSATDVTEAAITVVGDFSDDQ